MTTTAAGRRAVAPAARVWGRVLESDGASVLVGGLSQIARIGDRLSIRSQPDRELPAEVVALDDMAVRALLMAPSDGLSAGQRAYLSAGDPAAPGWHWLGRVVDAFGHTIGDAPPCHAGRSVPLRRQPPGGGLRRGFGVPLSTGYAVLDTMLPLCRGQRLGVFAGSGVGKSSLIEGLSKNLDADVVVVGLIGERGREVGDFARQLAETDRSARTVVIAATSDETALVKRRAGLLTLATAEYFRDQGLHVLCLFDSVTRFAEAHREIALAAGEPAALRAFPPSTAGELAALCERAGPGASDGGQGDITAIFTVLVAGSDMDEPVADMIRGVLDGHVVLTREIAERGRFPAIDLPASVSRAAPACWSPREAALAVEARKLISTYEHAATMIRAGLYVTGSDPDLDLAIRRYPALDGFIGGRTEGADRGESFARLAAILEADGPGAAAAAGDDPSK